MGNVVDPWQQTTEEEEEDKSKQLEEGVPWLLQHLPALKELHKQARKQTELRTCWTHLRYKGMNRKIQDLVIRHMYNCTTAVKYCNDSDSCANSKRKLFNYGEKREMKNDRV